MRTGKTPQVVRTSKFRRNTEKKVPFSRSHSVSSGEDISGTVSNKDPYFDDLKVNTAADTTLRTNGKARKERVIHHHLFLVWDFSLSSEFSLCYSYVSSLLVFSFISPPCSSLSLFSSLLTSLLLPLLSLLPFLGLVPVAVSRFCRWPQAVDMIRAELSRQEGKEEERGKEGRREAWRERERTETETE